MNDLPILGHGATLSKVSVQDILAHQVVAMSALPPSEVVISYNHPNYNQKKIGKCTAEDLCDMAEQIFGIPFSVAFTYWGGKSYDGNLLEGSSNVSMMSYGHNVGFLPLALDPDGNNSEGEYSDFLARRHSYTAEQIAAAGHYKILYSRVQDLSPIGIATALAASKYGLITMMEVGDNFYADANHNITWDKSRLQMLNAPIPVTGGHSIKILESHGLDENQIRHLRNSWGGIGNPTTAAGDIWCEDGNIDYVYKTQQPYVREAFIISKLDGVTFKHKFVLPIKQGDSSPEVTALQRVLVQAGFLVMPKGVAYGYYGSVTAAAVLKFQKQYMVATTAVLDSLKGSTVGPATRIALNTSQGL